MCFKKMPKHEWNFDIDEFNNLVESLPPTSPMEETAKGYKTSVKEYWNTWIYCDSCGFDCNVNGAYYCGGCGRKLKVVGVAKSPYLFADEYELEDFEEDSDAKEKEES